MGRRCGGVPLRGRIHLPPLPHFRFLFPAFLSRSLALEVIRSVLELSVLFGFGIYSLEYLVDSLLPGHPIGELS